VKALLQNRLDALQAAGILRDPAEPLRERAFHAAQRIGVPLLNASSNDYLGWRSQPVSAADAPPGAGASRLIYGTDPAHPALERELASWLGQGSALLFSSGYAANLGTLAGLAVEGDVVVSDALNHASLIDGCRLSKASVVVVPHRDYAAVEAALAAPRRGHAWVVTEAYFSMDADTPDLPRLAAMCRSRGASLIVDEAHSLGVFGPAGTGLCAAAHVKPDVLIGTLGKAFGLQGAFVCGSAELRTWLWNRARSFVFSTASSPLLAAEASQRLIRLQSADAERALLASAERSLAPALARFQTPDGRHGPVLPLILGTEAAAAALAAHFADAGILVQAIRPPTVPVGQARVRLTLNARMTSDDLARIGAALESYP
jgi:8-amino-7-oxononanoate synthase